MVAGYPVVEAVGGTQHHMSHYAGVAQVGLGVAALGEIEDARGPETVNRGLVGMAVRVVIAHFDDADPGPQLGQEGRAG